MILVNGTYIRGEIGWCFFETEPNRTDLKRSKVYDKLIKVLALYLNIALEKFIECVEEEEC